MLKVLLVDDDEVVNNGLKKLIPWHELNAVVIGDARNGQTALEQALEERPDLIITDIRMPVMDGLELCKRISEAMIDTSVILLSGYEDFSYAKAAMNYGVKDYIIKPIDRPKLTQLIEKTREISLRLDRRNKIYSDFAATDIENRLFDAVRECNESDVFTYFEKQFDCLLSDSSLIREMCFKYLSALFQIAARLGLKPETCGINKNEVIANLFECKSIGELKNLVYKNYLSLIKYVSDKKDSKSINLIEEIEQYLNANFTDPDLTVASTAERFNITANYLSILFRQVKGGNIGSKISRLRIERAKELLKHPNISIANVSRESGYLDMHYFSKAFKKSEGLTPSEFRNLTYNSSRDVEQVC